MFDVRGIQAALGEFGLDGWLLCDFRGSNVLARRILAIGDAQHTTRRFYYFIPREGTPVQLVHRIESEVLAHLPGERRVYLSWQELQAGITDLVSRCERVAMEYSPGISNPYTARVDAGTVEVVRAAGVDVVSSGDLVQRFEATWTDRQWELHLEAEKITTAAFEVAFGMIGERTRDGGEVRETEVQRAILEHFARHDAVTDHAPIVAVGPHSGDPHYAPEEGADGVIRQGDFVLVDQWAKLDTEDGVYSDLTRVAYVGTDVPEKYQKVFAIVATARDAAIARVREAMDRGERLEGWQVDAAAREMIVQAGYGDAFCHRLGHSIGRETHGNGANMDNLETREERQVMRRTCFSIEPGIYLDEFGIRSEVNVFVDGEGEVHVTGGPAQKEVLAIT